MHPGLVSCQMRRSLAKPDTLNDDHLSATVPHRETDEDLVLYHPLYGDRWLTVRPLAIGNEHVERDGDSGPRFSYIGPLPSEHIAQLPRVAHRARDPAAL